MNPLATHLSSLIKEFEEDNICKVNNDPWRLNYHIMAPVGWINDPNGLCEFKGKYHVFYQYSPSEPQGGLKYWAHCTTTDFINWTQEEIALYPDSIYDCHGVYSGSALIDEDRMYLYYTGNVKHDGDYDYINSGREQNTLVISSQDGYNFSTKQIILRNSDYPENMSNHVRDPKVWREGDSYYMVLGARDKNSEGEVLLYNSKDKINWQYLNSIKTKEKLGYMWECPDIIKFEDKTIIMLSPQGLEAEGILYNNVYQTGYMFIEGDIKSEYSLSEFVEIDRGFDFYAPQSFKDSKGRRIMIGWMGLPDIPYKNPTTENGWQHALTMPRELKVIDGKVHQVPLVEFEKLRSSVYEFDVINDEVIQCNTRSFEAIIEFSEKIEYLKISLRKDVHLSYSEGTFTMSLGESGFGRDSRSVNINSLQNLRIFSDESCLEVFLNNGEEVFTTRVYDDKEDTTLTVNQCNAKATGKVYSLNKFSIK